MPDADALFWALRSTYGGQCVEDRHGLIFAGHGFVVHLRRNGELSVRAAEGRTSPAQGWLLGALADFLSPAGARRDVHGVAVLSGRHVVHFRADGTVSVGALADTEPAAAGHPAGGAGATWPAWSLDSAPPGATLPQAAWRRAQGVREAARPGDLAPDEDTAQDGTGPATESPPPEGVGQEDSGPGAGTLAQAIAELAARWPGPLPDPPAERRRALLREIRAGRARVNDLLTRLRDEQDGDPRERRAATLVLVRIDATLRSAAQRLSRRETP